MKPGLRSGDLRHVCNIERLVVGQDDTGAPTSGYAVWAQDVRFAIDDWKGIENFITAQVQSALVTMIRIRYRPGVAATMRLAHRTLFAEPDAGVDHYEIIEVIRDPTLRWDLRLVCTRQGLATA